MRKEETSVSIPQLLHAHCQFARFELWQANLILIVLIPTLFVEKEGASGNAIRE